MPWHLSGHHGVLQWYILTLLPHSTFTPRSSHSRITRWLPAKWRTVKVIGVTGYIFGVSFASNSEIKEFVEAQSQKESGSETTPSEAYVQGGGVIYNLLLSIPCSDLHPTVAVEHAHAQCVAWNNSSQIWVDIQWLAYGTLFKWLPPSLPTSLAVTVGACCPMYLPFMKLTSYGNATPQ